MPVAFHPPLEHPLEPPPAARGNDDGANADLFAALLCGAAAAADVEGAPRAAGERHGTAQDDDSSTATFDALAVFAAAAGINLGLAAGHVTAPGLSPATPGDVATHDARTPADTVHAARAGAASVPDPRTMSPQAESAVAADPAGPRVPHGTPARTAATARGAAKPTPLDPAVEADAHLPAAQAKSAAALPAPLVQAAALLARAGDASKSPEALNATKAADDVPGMAANAAASAPSAPPPIVRTVAEAVGTPGFAPALAQEMAQLVRVNAQRAELHLHPAEMGPIDVRLHMQDNQVSVTMVAADAQTRDAMQQALPQLREALAREGLALADASVHDQPRREPGAPPAPPRTPRDGDFAVHGVDAAADVASAVRARRLVDLYA